MSARERIAWLAELSAERRELRRRTNCSAAVAITWQTSKAYAAARGLGDRYGRWAETVYLRGAGVEFTPRQPKPLPLVVPQLPGKRFRRIVRLQDGLCYLCGGAMSEPTREHVTPKVLGGRNARNVLAAHQPCNVRKSGRPPRPCELLYLEAVYLRLDAGEGILPA